MQCFPESRLKQHTDTSKEKPAQVARVAEINHHPTGRNLWLQFDKVVFLEEQMRQTDKRYSSLLTDLRTGSLANLASNLKLLQSRVVGSIHAQADATFENFKGAVIITTRNAVRCAINYKKTKVAAISQGEKQVVILAHDKLVETGRLNPRQSMDLLHTTDNKTADLAGMLACVSDMPVVIKANLATELGICNGTRCTLGKVVFAPSTPSFSPESTTGQTQFIRHMPLMIIVKIPPKIDPVTQEKTWKFKRFDKLLPGEFPIFPVTKKFDYKYKTDGAWHTTSIQRTQFPLITGYALTGYTAQGQTFDRAVLDITRPTGRGVGMSSSADLYVLLSRIKTTSGVLILRPFQESILTQKPNEHMMLEMERLRHLDQSTAELLGFDSRKPLLRRGTENHHKRKLPANHRPTKRRGKGPQI